MNPIVEKIDAFLSTLSESQHGDLAAKVLKIHGIPFEGRADKIVNGIASAHGIPRELVPQVLHHAALEARDRDEFYDEGNSYRTDLGSEVSAYAAASPKPQHNIESAVDPVKEWHRIVTHKHGAHALMQGNNQFRDHPDGISSSENRNALEQMHERFSHIAHTYGPTSTNAAHMILVDRAKSYDPMRMSTWRPHGTTELKNDKVYASLPLNKNVGSGKEYASEQGHRADTMNQIGSVIRTASRLLDGASGIKPSFPASAEHVAPNGAHYKAYTLDTPEKANDRCWGDRYCISTHGHAQRMNEMYHGGTYKTTHIITKVSKGDDGNPVERIHSAYLPELLPRGLSRLVTHEDPEQAVRNSGNNGSVSGDAFSHIHPLLSKLDSRIDSEDYRGIPAHVYYRHGASEYREGGDKYKSPERVRRDREEDSNLLKDLGA